MRSSHSIRFAFDQDSVSVQPVCHEGPSADCRVVPRNGCDCESYSVDRADDGTPFHRVDTFGGAEVLHWMDEGGECNVCLFLQDATTEDAVQGQEFLLADVPVDVLWEGDHYEWKRKRRGGVL